MGWVWVPVWVQGMDPRFCWCSRESHVHFCRSELRLFLVSRPENTVVHIMLLTFAVVLVQPRSAQCLEGVCQSLRLLSWCVLSCSRQFLTGVQLVCLRGLSGACCVPGYSWLWRVSG